MRPAQQRLLSLAERIFEDGVVTSEERAELAALYREAGLTVTEVREVFATFVRATWGEVVADGVVTPQERAKLIAILRALRLPPELVPSDVARAIAEVAA